MKTAIILHGMPSKEEYFNAESPAQSNKHWLPWVQRQLILNGILAQTVELPEPYEPNYEKWRSVFEQFHIDEETNLIGHSCGGGFLVRWLSENKIKVGKVALVAPWLDPERERRAGTGALPCKDVAGRAEFQKWQVMHFSYAWMITQELGNDLRIDI